MIRRSVTRKVMRMERGHLALVDQFQQVTDRTRSDAKSARGATRPVCGASRDVRVTPRMGRVE